MLRRWWTPGLGSRRSSTQRAAWTHWWSSPSPRPRPSSARAVRAARAPASATACTLSTRTRTRCWGPPSRRSSVRTSATRCAGGRPPPTGRRLRGGGGCRRVSGAVVRAVPGGSQSGTKIRFKGRGGGADSSGWKGGPPPQRGAWGGGGSALPVLLSLRPGPSIRVQICFVFRFRAGILDGPSWQVLTAVGR